MRHLLADQLERRVPDKGVGQPGFLVLLVLVGGLNVRVGQHHRAHLDAPLVERAREGEVVQHVVAEATDRALLDGNQHVVRLGQPLVDLLD